MSAMNCACRSVGNPGCGAVLTSMARQPCRSAARATPSSRRSISTPASSSFDEQRLEVLARARPRTSTSPPVMAPAIRSVPASMRSGMTRWSKPPSSRTPSIVIIAVPAPRDARAHPVERGGEVLDLGLARGVLDRGDAVGERRRHHQVLGGADRREVEHDPRAAQTLRLGLDVAVRLPDRRAQALEARRGGCRPDGCRSRSRRASTTRACPKRATSGPSARNDARIVFTSS